MVPSDARSTLVAETLARLHDITVPTAPPLWPPHWPPHWPPTPGVWLVLLLALLLLTLALRALSRRWRDGAWRRAARRELAMLRARIAACDDDGERSRLLAELATLLRRAALHTAAREDVAALSGADWLAYLVNRAPAQGAPAPAVAAALADGPYAPPGRIDSSAALAACDYAAGWIAIQRSCA